jgi:hypothetical protein
MFVKILAGPSVSEKTSKIDKNSWKMPKLRKSPVFCTKPPYTYRIFHRSPQMFVKILAGPSVSEKTSKIDKNSWKMPNSARALSFAPKPSNHSKKSQNYPKTSWKDRFPLQASKAHILWSKAPFSVIFVSKFSEFIALSIIAFIHNKLIAALYLFVFCVICVRKFHARAVVWGFLGASLWRVWGFLYRATTQVSLINLHLLPFRLFCSM